MKHLLLSFLILLLWPFCSKAQNETKDNESSAESYYAPVKYRSIGPFRGGRSVGSCGVPGDPLTYYMGTTGGGLWKTEDAGMHWHNVSDGYFQLGSVGAVAVADSDPNIVYVGMGEHAPRGVMTSHGDGVYKSTDAGKSWKHLGLEKTQHIARVRIHPDNPDIVYIAAQGALHSGSEERGIYKSTDGGQTWKNVLYVNDLTGCSELAMDPTNPNILYATMWHHQRLPWKVISGGPGSGVYKSTDAGETWFKIEDGLPEEKGKMAISVSAANPSKVYCLVESDSNQDKGGLFVSEDAGESWSMVSGDNRLTQRAWYYIEVFADPNDENTVYVLSAPALKSIDGGKSWTRITGTHGDYHDLWINPDNSKNLCISNDGGAAISFNGGKTWSTQSNMPTAQFYRINTDNQFPYRIYGGQQDNSSVSIAHREFESSTIGFRSWDASAGGESAFLAFDPDDPRLVMGGSYLGTIEIYDNRANAGTNIMAAPIQYLGREARDMKYRFNWNAPIIWSKHEPGTFYHAAQLVLRTRDQGQTWEEVSPDLSRNDDSKQGNGGGPYTNEAVGAENYGTIAYLAESPHNKGEIWAGTDDGYVQVTRNGGETWTNVTPKGLQESLVNAIDLSPHSAGTAFIATTRYKFDDKKPSLWKTTDYGMSWTNITGNIPDGSYTRVIRQDTEDPELLFAGTETGVFVSYNGGKEWETLQLNLPKTPILDLKVAHDDLIVATSGRSFWILDDVELLRQEKPESEDVHVYEPAPVVMTDGRSELDRSGEKIDGTDPLEGVNPAGGAVIYYHLPELADSVKVVMTITDMNNEVIRVLDSEKDEDFKSWDGGPSAEPVIGNEKGLNRHVWDLRYGTMPGVEDVYIEGSFRGHKVSPGQYKVTVQAGEWKDSSEITLTPNPLYPTTMEQYKEYDEFMKKAEQKLTEMHLMVSRMDESRKTLEQIVKKLPDNESNQELRNKVKEIIKRMKSWDEDMVQRKSKAYDDVENFPNKFTANYLYAINSTESDLPRVTQPSKDRVEELNTKWKELKASADEIINKELPDINKALWEAGIGALMIEGRA
ncbi:WD40/YVTN/BNR-like repeat-containing protein [Portibacter marinus]|uniref:WD40/YVTN/BNR-like repeat-containing protein n=1 Tax=Portibacter marinus TaxID=2898660 RepID=UPI001F47EFED|nr:glycosyl hydrolase [Portibacter marinus]